jgi:hypothetical protein
MGRAETTVEAMRRTKTGWAQADFLRILEHFGFLFVRHVRHGAMYRHPLLASHPDLSVRVRMAQVVIPKGTSLRDYVTDEVLARIDLLSTYEREIGNE